MSAKLGLICILVLVITRLGVCLRQSFSNVALRESPTDLVLLDQLIAKVAEGAVIVHDDPNYLETKQRIIKKVSNNNYDECYDSIRRYTRDMYKEDYKKMLLYTFKDIGDMGDLEACESLPGARYNILQLNVTNLPVEVRLGLCLPKECSQAMMKNAGDVISSNLSSLVSTLAKTLSIGLLIEYNVGVEISFIQPTDWSQGQKDSKTTAASAIGAFLFLFIGIAAIASIADEMKPKPSIKDDMPFFKTGAVEAAAFTEEVRARESTKPFTFKFKQNENGEEVKENPIENQYDEQHPMANSLFDNRLIPMDSEKEPSSLISDFIMCFSVKRNIYSLIDTKRLQEDDKELDVVEGIKVLTMCWGIITAISLYILTTNIRNLYIMLDLFKTYLFALVASGNLSPDLFIFVIYFIGFIKLNQYYDKNNGIGVKGYVKVLLHRFFKIAPLYYIVFFSGWFIFPLLSSKGSWYVSERLFWNCEAQWYYVLLFVNNLAPFFTKALEG